MLCTFGRFVAELEWEWQAISIATGISEKEIGLLMVGRIEPTDEQCEILDRLLKSYKVAVKFVNVETMKGRL